MRIATFLLLVLLTSTSALAQTRARLARGRTVSRSLVLDAGRRTLAVQQVWEITRASRGELLAVRPRLMLRGPAGLLGGRALVGASRARTNLTDDGVEGSITTAAARGTSRLTIGATELRRGEPVIRIHEIGEYALELDESVSLWRAEVPALVSLEPAVWSAMGTRRDELFDGGGVLVDAINDARLKWPGLLE